MNENLRPHMPKRDRQRLHARLLEFWDAEIGERPDNLVASLGSFVRLYGADRLFAALKRAADSTRDDAEGVLELVRDSLRQGLV